VAVESDGLLDILDHPNKAKYPNQRIFVVAMDGYVCLVPFVDEVDRFFLKTIIPSRKAATSSEIERTWILPQSPLAAE